jgi:hypothetical protein
LDLVDESLEAFLRATVPLSAQDVDVSFEAPDREWSAKLNRPTLNLFLWDIRRSSERARAGVETIERNGEVVRRLALPRVELRYLTTAWTSDHGDERALLSGLMRTLLAHHEIPATFVVEALRSVPAPTLLMARAGDDQPDAGKILDGQLKPAISLLVVAAVDTDTVTPAGPPVAAFELRTFDRRGAASSSPPRRVAGEVADPALVGARVRSPHGSAVVSEMGRFLIPAEPGDELVVDSDPPRTVTVPSEGGVRIG